MQIAVDTRLQRRSPSRWGGTVRVDGLVRFDAALAGTDIPGRLGSTAGQTARRLGRWLDGKILKDSRDSAGTLKGLPTMLVIQHTQQKALWIFARRSTFPMVDTAVPTPGVALVALIHCKSSHLRIKKQ